MRWWAFVAVFGLSLSGCKQEQAAADAGAAAAAPSSKPPPDIRVSADRTDLVFSYEVEGGAYQTATRIDEIPQEARTSVVITDLSLTPEQRQAGKYIYVADLTRPRDDGSYPVALASRFGFELGAADGEAPSSGKRVVLYSASWCGVCKKAARLMRDWGVPFEEKDIEASKKAATELAAKAQRAGVAPRGVPVIDVAGQLLLGLDAPTLQATLKDKGFL